jgi:hypothetical protein
MTLGLYRLVFTLGVKKYARNCGTRDNPRLAAQLFKFQHIYKELVMCWDEVLFADPEALESSNVARRQH